MMSRVELGTAGLESLGSFLKNASVGIHCVALDGTILWANHTELCMLGYTRGEYCGHHIDEFHADADVLTDLLNRLAAGETLTNSPARLTCKDRTIKHVLINSNVYRNGGEFVHTRCFTRDVSDAVAIQEALRLSEERYRTLAEASHDQIFVLDRDSRIDYGNPCAAAQFGQPASWARVYATCSLQPLPNDRRRGCTTSSPMANPYTAKAHQRFRDVRCGLAPGWCRSTVAQEPSPGYWGSRAT